MPDAVSNVSSSLLSSVSTKYKSSYSTVSTSGKESQIFKERRPQILKNAHDCDMGNKVKKSLFALCEDHGALIACSQSLCKAPVCFMRRQLQSLLVLHVRSAF